jgi:trehalose/maltose hydrolase-like predicted phosphorylase
MTKNVEFYQTHAKLSLYNQFFLSIVGLEETVQDSYDYLMESLSIYKDSLLHKEKLFGGVYYHLVHRMSRLRKDHHQFSVNTWIPKEVRRLEYPIQYQEYMGKVKIKRNSAQINWSKEDES